MLLRTIVVAVVLLGAVSGAAAAAWVRVADAGLGDPDRGQVDAIAVFGDHVYVASHDGAGAPSVLRAAIATDTLWEVVTPPWDTGAGEVVGLQVVGDALYVGTSGGQIWRHGRRGVWTAQLRPWPDGTPVIALGGWDPGDGPRLCVMVEEATIWCRAAAGWDPLPFLPIPPAERETVRSGQLAGFLDELYVGLGGGSAGDRACEAWRFGVRDGWRAVTRDCFGRPELTWIALGVFERRVYFGTSGHVRPVVMRWDGHALEDVTPSALYECAALFGRCPVHYNAFAVSAGRLHLGTRTGGLGSEADLLSTPDGEAWAFDSLPGFGNPANGAITALGSRDAYLYAGTFNTTTGFEVWRRTPPLADLIPPMLADLWELQRFHGRLIGCLLRGIPCPPDWARLHEPIAEIELALTVVADEATFLVELKAARAAMAEARLLAAGAEQLAAMADKLGDPRQARPLRHEATAAVGDAIRLTRGAVADLRQAVGAGTALPPKAQD